ncbi:MAG: rod shape-determining protein MreD [Chloroflexota bacterium]
MNPLIGLPLFILFAALQAVLGHVLSSVPGARPQLVVLAVVTCGLMNGPRNGAVWGALGGLALDLASAGPVGTAVLPLVLTGFLSGFGQTAALRLHRLLPLEAGVAGAVVYGLLHMLLLQLSGWDFNWIVAIYEVILPSALISLFAMPLVYGLIYWLERRLRPRAEPRW